MFIITIIVMYILFVDVFMYMNVYVHECSRVFYSDIACHLYSVPESFRSRETSFKAHYESV